MRCKAGTMEVAGPPYVAKIARRLKAAFPPDTPPKPRRYRIRHCNGNKAAWMLVALRDDGTEIDSYGGFTTSVNLDLLLKHAGHLTPVPGDLVELVP